MFGAKQALKLSYKLSFKSLDLPPASAPIHCSIAIQYPASVLPETSTAPEPHPWAHPATYLHLHLDDPVQTSLHKMLQPPGPRAFCTLTSI